MLIALGVPQPVEGETDSATTTTMAEENLLNLTLPDCLDIAFQNNRLRAVSRESIKIAEAQRDQALSAYWPQLNLGVTATRMDEDPNFIFPSQPLPLGDAAQPFAEAIANAQLAKRGITPDNVGLPAYNSALSAAAAQAMNQLSSSSMPAQNIKLMDRDLLTSTLSLIYPLYTGGKISALTKQAVIGVDVSKEQSRQTDLQIARDVKQYFYGHIFAKKLHTLGRETLDRLEATEILTESIYRHGSGKVKKTDYLRAKVMTAAVRSAVELLKSNEELTRSALVNAMGLPWNTSIGLADVEIPFAPYGSELEELVEQAYSSNPQINQVRLGLKAGEAKIAEARSGHLPIVAFFGNFNRLENSYSGGLNTAENRNSWQIGLSLDMTIFNGFRTSKEVLEARLRLDKLRNENMLLEEGVALQVKNAFLQIARSQGQVKTTKDALDAATENRELNIRAYQQEMVETKDVIEAQLMEFFMHGQYLHALYDNQVNSGELEFIIGSSVYEDR
ncbi:MAG TPA: TolC family protein [Thermodesulfobacteriota bacterium]|nr:TolC family protein [Thermodesulfobacteriota bacterium]